MNSGVKDISLRFITSLNSNRKMCQELHQRLSDIVSPGNFLENLPDFKAMVVKIDSSLSRDKNNIQYLISSYKQALSESKATISSYISRIEERMNSQDQMNMNVTFWDEEKQLSKSCYREYDDNPANYSMLSIMKRITNEEENNLSCLEKIVDETTPIYKWYVSAQSDILNIKIRLEDSDFVKAFTHDYLDANAEREIQKFQRLFDDVSRNCVNAKNMITSIFQMFLALDQDYKIYAAAVDRFEQHALESYFSTGYVTTGVI